MSKVKCTVCRQVCFETTDKYDPNITANGSMVRKLVPWVIDWLCASTTLASEMTCPKCGVAQLAPAGKLTVVPEAEAPPWKNVTDEEDDANVKKVIDKAFEQAKELLPNRCPVCDDPRVFKSKAALMGHMRSHSKKGA